MGRLAAAGGILFVLAILAGTLADPTTLFCVSRSGAPWVRVDRPFTAQPFGDAALTSDFRTSFELGEPAENVTLQAAVLEEARVYLDRQQVAQWIADRDEWKQPRTVRLGDIPAGRHELLVIAVNQRGPNALSVACERLPELSTASVWEGTELSTGWRPVVSVEERPLTEIASQFPSSLEAFRQVWPVALVVIVMTGGGSLWFSKGLSDPARRKLLTSLPGVLRLACLFAFAVLAGSNLARGWLGDGFDYFGHADYVSFIAGRGSLPLPRDGLQMFQSPLYYIVGAVLVKTLSLFVSVEQALRWLVLINLACGLALIEICYRTLRAVLPGRPAAQSLGMLACGLLPMTVYFSQYVGNQSLEGVFSALALMLAMQYLAAEEWATGWQLTRLGVVIGLALLSKVNAVVPAALIVAVMTVRSVLDQRSAWLTGEDLFFLLSPILLIAGWYYFRNWLNFGRPFLGGWGADAAFKWWQDRGFNAPSDLLRFGQGVLHPVYAGFGSLWDGFYSSMWLDAHLGGGDFRNRPRWNDPFVISSALIGIIPTAGMVVGLALPVVRREAARPALLFASVAAFALIGTYLAYNLRNPCFASGKAFYVIGGLPCFAVLAGLGLDVVTRPRAIRPMVIGAVACVPVWSIASYFIVK